MAKLARTTQRSKTANPDAGNATDWAGRISACWRQSLDAIIAVGKLLSAAKAALPHGAFTAMVENDLPFGPRAAQRLMAIAGDSRITNTTHVSVLPSSWGTLYEITKLDDKEFKTRIKDGTIHPEMERRDIATVVKKQNRAKREVDLGAKQCALPARTYGVIYADPPWSFKVYSRDTGMDRSAENHYPTQTLEEIKALDVPSISADDAVLFLWATVPMLPQALEVMQAWRFEYKSHCVWIKHRHNGMGYWFRNTHELLLVGIKGEPPAPAPGTQRSSVFEVAPGAHSAKPEHFLKMIESFFPTMPKIELNRRGPAREGWDAWGNEAVQ